MPKIAKIILPLSINQTFDYQIPPAKKVERGMRVVVNFRGKKQLGVVYLLSSKTKFNKIKPLQEILENKPCLSQNHFCLAEKLVKKYPYPLSEFIFSMLPPYLRKENRLGCNPSSTAPDKNSSGQNITFIKGGLFSQRYLTWKTEIEKALQTGSVILCLPQIGYLKEAKYFLKKDFPDKIAEFFSRQNPKESFSNWIKSRKNSLILGTRSSLFYFPQDTRLIILEEEASPYYFQETKPFYHLRQVAFSLSEIIKSKLILAGNHPSLYTYQKIKNKKINLNELKNQKNKIEIVRRDNFTKNKYISPVLLELIRKTISEKKQGVIVWNKKSFWRLIACNYCQQALKCSHCSGFLQQESKNSLQLLCPYCQKKIQLPKICPECKKGYLKGKGLGIEKIKEVIKIFFPEINISNLENYTRKSQIIISTSKIINLLFTCKKFEKGFVLDIDSFLNNFDFNTTFNAYLYLKNLSLLFKDSLFVFSSRPNYYLFSYLNKKWQSFYDYELQLRKELNLPPFIQIVKVTLRSPNPDKALKNSKKLYNIFKQKNYQVFGPFKENPYKLRQKYRYSLIIKTEKKSTSKKEIYSEIERTRQSQVQTAIIIQ